MAQQAMVQSNPAPVGGQVSVARPVPTEKKSRMWLWILIGVVVVIAIGFAIWWFMK